MEDNRITSGEVIKFCHYLGFNVLSLDLKRKTAFIHDGIFTKHIEFHTLEEMSQPLRIKKRRVLREIY